jgi:hypothetical protein
MRETILALAIAISSTMAYAQNCKNGQCRPVQKATTATAQGVANMMARLGRIGHFGGNPYSYEGTGMGSTPEQALNNCCYSRSGMKVADQGVAQCPNGQWVACKRYVR